MLVKQALGARPIIKCNLRGLESDNVDRITLAYKNVSWRLVDFNENAGSLKDGNYLDSLNK
jgi:hypothetical protein